MPQESGSMSCGSGRIRLFNMQQKQFREAKINEVPYRGCPDGCWDTVSPRELGGIIFSDWKEF